MSAEKLTSFKFDGETLQVNFIETLAVKDGVECDVYSFVDDESKDLAIVTVKAGYKTPLQRILLGEKTIEGFCKGVGVLTVTDNKGQQKQYSYETTDAGETEVLIGQTMQWYANSDSDLVFYEVCWPPYADGRFENIEE